MTRKLKTIEQIEQEMKEGKVRIEAHKTVEMYIVVGKGVLGKDKQPFAPASMFVENREWRTPVAYSVHNLLLHLNDSSVPKIVVITEDNTEYTITKI